MAMPGLPLPLPGRYFLMKVAILLMSRESYEHYWSDPHNRIDRHRELPIEKLGLLLIYNSMTRLVYRLPEW